MQSLRARNLKFLKSNLENNNIPLHVAFIMDGNGRWAKKRGLSRKFGHKAGVETLLSILNKSFEIGIKYVTVYAFSTENWNRPKEEVDALLELFRVYFTSKFDVLLKNRIKINIWGDVSSFPEDIKNMIDEIEKQNVDDYVGTFNIALNYGGRNEIVNAINYAVENNIKVDENSIKDLLYSKQAPDPDVVIRTGGEQRLSNFLLYQSAYSELFFTKTLWPDFTPEELLDILTEYQSRDRRFGKVK